MLSSKCELVVLDSQETLADLVIDRDWKKLTFYYFADSYINFNCLVTDLFKIYKTRIWMSAINPASFVTPPTAGLSGPSGMSNPLYSQDTAHADHRHHDGRAYGGAREGIDTGREGLPNPVGMIRTAFGEPYQSFAQPSRQTEGWQSDPFAPYSPTGYGSLETGFSDYPASSAGSNGAARSPAQGEWVGRFQSLSLNS